MNENSETVELPLTDIIYLPDLLSFGSGFRTGVRDRATGPGYWTNIQGDFFFKGQKVNSYYYTIKHVYYIKIYILIITTLGHLVCT